MQAGGPLHDALVSLSAGDPGAEADGQGAGGCEGVSVGGDVFGGMLKIVGRLACCERNPSEALVAGGELTGELA